MWKWSEEIFFDEIGRPIHSCNLKLHGKNPINTPIPCLSALEDFGDEVPVLSRRIVCLEIDEKNILRKITEDGFPDQTREGYAHPISLKACFTDQTEHFDTEKTGKYAVIGKPMPEISELE